MNKQIKPNFVPTWAENGTNVTAPSVGQADVGLNPATFRSLLGDHFNHLFREIYRWIRFLSRTSSPKDEILSTRVAVEDSMQSATIWYDSALGVFKDAAGAPVVLPAGARVRVDGVDALTADLVFPAAVELEFMAEVNLGGHGLTLADVRGEIRATGGTVTLGGNSEATKISGAALTVTQGPGFSGSYFLNGVLTSPAEAAQDSRIEVLGGRKNRLDNGWMDLWQRGTDTGAGHSAIKFVADRYFSEASGSSYQTRQSAVALGLIADGCPRYAMETLVTSVAGAGNFVRVGQRIEGVWSFCNTLATFSFWAKASVAGKSVAVEAVQHFGTGGGSAEVTGIGVTKLALSGGADWTRYQATFTLPSLFGKVLGTGADWLEVRIWLDAGATFDAQTGGLGQQGDWSFFWTLPQLEPGAYATRREQRSLAEELAGCLRYFWHYEDDNGQAMGSGWADMGTQTFIFLNLPVPMRAAPSLTGYSPVGSWLVAGPNIGGQAVSGVSLPQSSPYTAVINFTRSASAIFPQQPAHVYPNGQTAYLEFSSEL